MDLPYNSGTNHIGGTYSIQMGVTYNHNLNTYKTAIQSTTLPQYNFLVNGDFALPVTTSATTFVSSGTNTIPGWTVVDGSVTISLNDYYNALYLNNISYTLYYPPINPTNVLVMSGNSYITQNSITQYSYYPSGSRYLSFYYVASNFRNQKDCTLNITVGDFLNPFFSTSLTIPKSSNTTWSFYSTNFNVTYAGSYSLTLTLNANSSTIGIGYITIY
jgi:hypothetical protein